MTPYSAKTVREAVNSSERFRGNKSPTRMPRKPKKRAWRGKERAMSSKGLREKPSKKIPRVAREATR